MRTNQFGSWSRNPYESLYNLEAGRIGPVGMLGPHSPRIERLQTLKEAAKFEERKFHRRSGLIDLKIVLHRTATSVRI